MTDWYLFWMRHNEQPLTGLRTWDHAGNNRRLSPRQQRKRRQSDRQG